MRIKPKTPPVTPPIVALVLFVVVELVIALQNTWAHSVHDWIVCWQAYPVGQLGHSGTLPHSTQGLESAVALGKSTCVGDDDESIYEETMKWTKQSKTKQNKKNVFIGWCFENFPRSKFLVGYDPFLSDLGTLELKLRDRGKGGAMQVGNRFFYSRARDWDLLSQRAMLVPRISRARAEAIRPE